MTHIAMDNHYFIARIILGTSVNHQTKWTMFNSFNSYVKWSESIQKFGEQDLFKKSPSCPASPKPNGNPSNGTRNRSLWPEPKANNVGEKTCVPSMDRIILLSIRQKPYNYGRYVYSVLSNFHHCDSEQEWAAIIISHSHSLFHTME